MAGGKETPRQKMIGMMYLVLTALLALQVANSVLEKFVFIDEALHISVEDLQKKNQAVLDNIATTVNEASDQKKEKVEPYLKRAQDVRKKTKEVLDHLNSLRTEFAVITGGGDPDGYDDATGQLIGIKDYDIVSNYMINEKNGEELEEKLNSYASYLAKTTEEKFDKLAKPAAEIEVAKNDPDQKMKDFAEYYFGHTPTAAGMATISHLESEVLQYEARALEIIGAAIGATTPKFDIFVPLVKPKNNTVAAGADFEADLYITASAKNINPSFKYNGKDIEQKEDDYGIKFGEIKFKATASNYDPKTLMADASFDAEVELNGEIYKIKHNYNVVKPVVQVKSAALSALYMNCGNELDIQVPALGTSYNPSFSSPEANTVKGSRTGLVTVVPTGRSKVNLTVSSGGSVLDKVTFDVKKPPLPTYTFLNRGKEVNKKDGEAATALRALEVEAVADENFKREVPKDADYRIREIDVTLARGTRPVKTQTFNSQSLNLSQFTAQARPGDRLVIEIKKVTRRTYEGKNENVQIRNEVHTIPLH